ncbi:MAG: DUF427 domain-containing protein [Pseudomonadota bacterium]
MSERKILVRRASGRWVVRAGGAVIAETRAALELFEGDRDPVIYFPREDAIAFLDPSDRVTSCPHKGEASYLHIAAKSGRIDNAAWSYETPIAGVGEIAGYIAFDLDKATVEQV